MITATTFTGFTLATNYCTCSDSGYPVSTMVTAFGVLLGLPCGVASAADCHLGVEALLMDFYFCVDSRSRPSITLC